MKTSEQFVLGSVIFWQLIWRLPRFSWLCYPNCYFLFSYPFELFIPYFSGWTRWVTVLFVYFKNKNFFDVISFHIAELFCQPLNMCGFYISCFGSSLKYLYTYVCVSTCVNQNYEYFSKAENKPEYCEILMAQRVEILTNLRCQFSIYWAHLAFIGCPYSHSYSYFIIQSLLLEVMNVGQLIFGRFTYSKLLKLCISA